MTPADYKDNKYNNNIMEWYIPNDLDGINLARCRRSFFYISNQKKKKKPFFFKYYWILSKGKLLSQPHKPILSLFNVCVYSLLPIFGIASSLYIGYWPKFCRISSVDFPFFELFTISQTPVQLVWNGNRNFKFKV